MEKCILRSIFGEDVVNHYTYVLHGDGDIQEPVAQGAIALAGHYGLGFASKINGAPFTE